jgi:hypothetical protein
MTTVRQLERLWDAGAYVQILQELLIARPESVSMVRTSLSGPHAAAALILVRLDELHQSQSQLYTKLIRHLLASQHPDGGWDDPMTTALGLRALLLGQGHGIAVERGLNYLANLQKDDGAWPAEPLRRMPADGLVTAFVLVQLGVDARFRERVRFAEAVAWMRSNELLLQVDVRRLWDRAGLRCRMHATASERTPVRGAA